MLTLFDILDSMKVCSKCKTLLSFDNFNKKGEGRLQPYCKPCDNAHSRERYANNREHHIKVIGKRNKHYLEELRTWTRGLKESSPCTDCNIYYPWYVMDFDHVRGEKVSDIALMVANRASKTRIQNELDKCELVCSNCHRIRTYTRRESK